MSKDIQAELKKAVALLGGPRRAETLSGIRRSQIEYWMHISVPEWRVGQAELVIALARKSQNRVKPVGDTPRWALARLKERRKDAVR